MPEGMILKGIGGFYYVDTGEIVVECRARGRFRKNKEKPLPGDRVEIDIGADATGYVTKILPRTSELLRPPVANLDCIVAVISQAPPVTDLFLIDKITVIACHKKIEPVICINKCDLEQGEALFETYSGAGFATFRISAETGEGVAALREHIRGKFSVFTGNSGVGKSSLLNRLCPDFHFEVGDISRINRGRNTTRQVEIVRMADGTMLADTPGFSSFDTERMDMVYKEELERAFPEFEPYLGQCRFTGCAHVKEKGCAVRAAVESGRIGPSRYESYCMLYQSVKDIQEWERARADSTGIK